MILACAAIIVATRFPIGLLPVHALFAVSHNGLSFCELLLASRCAADCHHLDRKKFPPAWPKQRHKKSPIHPI